MKYLRMFVSFFCEIKNKEFSTNFFFLHQNGLSHSSLGFNELDSRQPIRGRECYSSPSCIPVQVAFQQNQAWEHT